MPPVKRIVSTSFWEDDKVVNSFTPEDKYFMLYLLTNPHTKQLGIYPLNVKMAAFETGYSFESVLSLLERFEKSHKIIVRSKTTSEIAIKNFLCYSVMKGGKPVLDCLYSDVRSVKDKGLLSFVIHHLVSRDDLTDTVSAFVKDMINKVDPIYNIEYNMENTNDKVNDNDNDNDSTVAVRSTYAKRTTKGKGNDDKKRKAEHEFQAGITEIISHLNNKTNTGYRPETKSTRECISKILKAGYTVDDCKAVIDCKVQEWNGTEMQKYLRPSTLFADCHFEEYLQASRMKKPSSQNRQPNPKSSYDEYNDLNKFERCEQEIERQIAAGERERAPWE